MAVTALSDVGPPLRSIRSSTTGPLTDLLVSLSCSRTHSSKNILLSVYSLGHPQEASGARPEYCGRIICNDIWTLQLHHTQRVVQREKLRLSYSTKLFTGRWANVPTPESIREP